MGVQGGKEEEQGGGVRAADITPPLQRHLGGSPEAEGVHRNRAVRYVEQAEPFTASVYKIDHVHSVITLQLQKLKRSLSFKTKSLRSKSADNFFQRNNSDVKLQADMLAEVSPGSSPLPAPGSLTSTPTRASLYPGGGGKAHTFQEHIFKKPTFCDVCNHMIVGKASPGTLLKILAFLESQERGVYLGPGLRGQILSLSGMQEYVWDHLREEYMSKGKGSGSRQGRSWIVVQLEQNLQLIPRELSSPAYSSRFVPLHHRSPDMGSP